MAGTARWDGWLLDAHVHFHACFDAGRFFAASCANFAAAAQRLNVAGLGCLALTEGAGQRFFETWREHGLPRNSAGWRAVPTLESRCLVIDRDDRPVLVLMAGRQIVTSEGIEVLALGCVSPVADGQPLAETLAQAAAGSVATVLPWGFGKWWFQRGRLVADALARADGGRVFVGDNGNRPGLVRTPPLLRSAVRRGVRSLPGSDPLPLPFHDERAGRAGVFVACEPDLARPTAQLEALLARGAPLREYREREPLSRFVRSQLLVQLQKHRQ